MHACMQKEERDSLLEKKTKKKKEKKKKLPSNRIELLTFAYTS